MRRAASPVAPAPDPLPIPANVRRLDGVEGLCPRPGEGAGGVFHCGEPDPSAGPTATARTSYVLPRLDAKRTWREIASRDPKWRGPERVNAYCRYKVADSLGQE